MVHEIPLWCHQKTCFSGDACRARIFFPTIFARLYRYFKIPSKKFHRRNTSRGKSNAATICKWVILRIKISHHNITLYHFETVIIFLLLYLFSHRCGRAVYIYSPQIFTHSHSRSEPLSHIYAAASHITVTSRVNS